MSFDRRSTRVMGKTSEMKHPSDDLSEAIKALAKARFRGFEAERADLQALVAATVSHGESNSVLLLGHRGTGKTAILEDVLAEEDVEGRNCRLVRLHGLTETNDWMALKKITRHLRLEGVVGDRVFVSFSEHLDFLLTSLRQDSEERDSSVTSVIFVLEEFDLFCAHHNQTLLYNLFDIAQSARKVPILVIGLTARIDVIEILEKRVQSRFGRRCIHLRKPVCSDEHLEFVRHFLLCDSNLPRQWRRHVEEFLSDGNVKSFFEVIFRQNSLVSFLKQFLNLALLLAMKNEGGHLSFSCLEEALGEMHQDLEQPPLLGLPMLDLTLLVAAMHVDNKDPQQSFNFEMAFTEYHKFASRRCSLLRHDRGVMLKCWENLLNLELIQPAERGGGTGRVQKEFRGCCLNILPHEIHMAVKNYEGLFMAVADWAKSGLEI